MKVNAITLRKGHVLDYNGKLWMVTHSEIMQPGKGASVIQVEMRDIKSGNKDNVRFRTQEVVERARLEQDEFQYLFNDGDNYTFMNQTSFEQMNVPKDIIGSPGVEFLKEGMQVIIETHEGVPLGVELPDSAVCEVVEAEPVVKGQTASSSYKPAILDNGLRTMVPPHIEVGTKIVVKTEDASYVERFKD
jgi:elongation factor P